MEIIPVIDIMNGKAVAGKAGIRETYTELKTVFADSSDPVEIAKNIPSEKLYVADLDGIMKSKPQINLLKKLAKIKMLILDAGVRNSKDLKLLSKLKTDIVVGTETLRNLETLKSLDAIVSIDIKNSEAISSCLPKDIKNAFQILSDIGIKRFIFLDISSVGSLRGFRFDFLNNLNFGDKEIIVGGGIKKEDLKKLEDIGISGVLVGTALHRGLVRL